MLGASGRRRARRKSQFGSCVPAQQDVQASTVAVDEAQIIRLETDVEASVTEYEADRVRTKAKSQADLIVSRANIAAAATIVPLAGSSTVGTSTSEASATRIHGQGRST